MDTDIYKTITTEDEPKGPRTICFEWQSNTYAAYQAAAPFYLMVPTERNAVVGEYLPGCTRIIFHPDKNVVHISFGQKRQFNNVPLTTIQKMNAHMGITFALPPNEAWPRKTVTLQEDPAKPGSYSVPKGTTVKIPRSKGGIEDAVVRWASTTLKEDPADGVMREVIMVRVDIDDPTKVDPHKDVRLDVLRMANIAHAEIVVAPSAKKATGAVTDGTKNTWRNMWGLLKGS